MSLREPWRREERTASSHAGRPSGSNLRETEFPTRCDRRATREGPGCCRSQGRQPWCRPRDDDQLGLGRRTGEGARPASARPRRCWREARRCRRRSRSWWIHRTGTTRGLGFDLGQAQRAVGDSMLWNLRVLSGWLPSSGSEASRVLAGWFEIANVDEMRRCQRGPTADLQLLNLGASGQRPVRRVRGLSRDLRRSR